MYIKKIYELSNTISKLQDKLDYYIRENINNINSIIKLQKENNNLQMQLISHSKEQEIKPFTLTSPSQVISAYLSGIGWKQCDFLLASLNIPVMEAIITFLEAYALIVSLIFKLIALLIIVSCKTMKKKILKLINLKL